MISKYKTGGFTLLELALVMVILGILVSIAFPRFGTLTAKAREAEVKASLGAIRSALSIYYSNTEGDYPVTLTGGLIAGAVYLNKLPLVSIPANVLNPGHPRVSGEKNLATVDDDVATGVWLYVNSGTNWGDCMVNCIHRDSRGTYWSSY